MIHYQRGGLNYIRNVLSIRGSVFPFAAMLAVPPALAAFLLKFLVDKYGSNEWLNLLKEDAPWSNFITVVSFVIVFRTSQAYARFWDGATSTHRMRAEWFTAASTTFAFCRHSKVIGLQMDDFKEMLVRLFSMLHALALAEIEDSTSRGVEDVMCFRLELIDPLGMDENSLLAIKESEAKVELVAHWIQQYIIANISTGVVNIPPPLLTRSFQQLEQGCVQYNEAIKISSIPFPFPYAQACDCLLFVLLLASPFFMLHFADDAVAVAIATFIQVALVWSLNGIAVEIENPFGRDDNDLEPAVMQEEMNLHLLALLEDSTWKTPQPSGAGKALSSAVLNGACKRHANQSAHASPLQSFRELWSALDVARTGRSSQPALTTSRSGSRKLTRIQQGYSNNSLSTHSQAKSSRSSNNTSRSPSTGHSHHIEAD